ncbi:MAG: hypothetical protein NUV45_12225 [Tepidanaerobacteraceae bacterium]|jgi:hypothetical protein|nr:hypothetical protein [Tepidanaerobacteraceae bacterium]
MYRHFLNMTDSTGIIQFADKSKPKKESGYTVDDNARALLVAMDMESKEKERLMNIYIRFLEEAQDSRGIWQNLKLDGKFSPVINSEDSMGRGIIAASFALNCGISDTEKMAKKILGKALPRAFKFNSPRAISYALIGIENLIDRGRYLWVLPYAKQMADKLIMLYQMNRSPDWLWFEDKLTYCNAVIPHALFGFYRVSGNARALKVAKDTLDFLTDSLFKKGYLNIVGNRGWWHRQSFIPDFDQQPVDAASVVLACLEAFAVTGESEYAYKARIAYDWYWGKNINGIPLYNKDTQGCHDALVPDGVNLNQGAEAVISFLMAHHAIKNVIEKKSQRLIPAV